MMARPKEWNACNLKMWYSIKKTYNFEPGEVKSRSNKFTSEFEKIKTLACKSGMNG